MNAFDEIKQHGRATNAHARPSRPGIAKFWTANVIRQYNGLARDVASAQALDSR